MRPGSGRPTKLQPAKVRRYRDLLCIERLSSAAFSFEIVLTTPARQPRRRRGPHRQAKSQIATIALLAFFRARQSKRLTDSRPENVSQKREPVRWKLHRLPLMRMPRRDNQPRRTPLRDSARWVIGIARESIRVKQARLRLPASPIRPHVARPRISNHGLVTLLRLNCYADARPVAQQRRNPRSLQPAVGTPCPFHFVRLRRRLLTAPLGLNFRGRSRALDYASQSARFALT